ncbi:MAG: putative thioredoxin [Rhodothermales bacterium]|jgi:putative thioredoxin
MPLDVTDFQTEVLDASKNTPILVDFWAPWCGPCRTLGPVLEKLEAEADGAWKLAKVNTDQMQEVSAQYGIRGIPAVKMIVDGEVVDEFTGALPEYAVKQWLEKALPSETANLVGEAEAALLAGETERAEKALEGALRDEPTNAAASALLSRLVVFRDPQRALGLAANGMSGEAVHVQMAEAVRVLVRVMETQETDLPLDGGAEHAARALGTLRAQDLETTMQSLLALLQTNRYYHDDFARKAGVAVFTVLGPEHEITRKHRRTFDMWLS